MSVSGSNFYYLRGFICVRCPPLFIIHLIPSPSPTCVPATTQQLQAPIPLCGSRCYICFNHLAHLQVSHFLGLLLVCIKSSTFYLFYVNLIHSQRFQKVRKAISPTKETFDGQKIFNEFALKVLLSSILPSLNKARIPKPKTTLCHYLLIQGFFPHTVKRTLEQKKCQSNI